MTRDIFLGWLQKFGEKVRDDGRSVCLVLDNCPAHHIEDLELTNVELKFLPPNCTSLIHPFAKGIISSVKCSHRRRLIDKLLLDLRLKRQTKVDIFQALEMLSVSWKVTAKEVINNCFMSAGFEIPAASDPEEVYSEEPNGGPSFFSTIPRGSEREDFFYGGSCVVTTEEFTDDFVVKNVLGESEDDESEADAEEPC
ncbi:hypothetical protein HPB47_004210 [Ixodes persulcatus]|uniref:Uncharacterized protein n=1 Tax=Ixodes persulcatus TaxID=34615 RepID=A0AC60PGT6_IXOPE|nr:hypothetical protein HPB47_004210 [Ixodes persulcatus]